MKMEQIASNDMLITKINNLLREIDWATLTYSQVQLMEDILGDNYNTAECELDDRNSEGDN